MRVHSAGKSTDEARVIRECAEFFHLGSVQEWSPHGGTAGKNWRVVTDRGVWLIRRRGARTSSPDCIRFDHALRLRLIECGVPTAAAVAGSNGQTWLGVHDAVYEAYPFQEGITLPAAHDQAVVCAGRALARFHAASADLREMAESLAPPAQYATLGVPDASSRIEDPELLSRVYRRLEREVEPASRWHAALRAAVEWVERLRSVFPDALYRSLPHTVVHGDYTLANLLFDERGEVRGIFDFDWARWGPRVRDVADGLFFIAGVRRRPLDPGDIWSLTEPVRIESRRCRLWLAGYEQISPLTSDERDCLAPALAARWLSVRVEGMAKVAPEARLEFCLGPMQAGLAEIEELAEAVQDL